MAYYGTTTADDLKPFIEKHTQPQEVSRCRKPRVLTTVFWLVLGLSVAVVLVFRGKLHHTQYATGDDDSSGCTASYNIYTTSEDMCNERTGPIVEGVDVVEYFVSGVATSTQGSSSHAVSYRGYDFYFSTSANAEVFAANPFQYAPRYGGFCAFGLSGEDPRNSVTSEDQLHTVPVSPDQFSIVDGALYLFRGEGARDLFMEDPATFIAGADATWAEWFGDAQCGGFYNTMCFM